MKSGIRVLIFILPAGVLAFIIFNALTPSAQSNEMTLGFLDTFFGRGLRDLVSIIQGAVPDDESLFGIARTVAHVCEYGLLGVTAYLALRMNLEHIPNVVYFLFFGVLAALGDETLQGFTAGRTSQVSDVLLDFGGFLLAVVLCLLLDRLFCGEWVTKTYRKRHASWR